jgi:hypothetical protein
MLSGVCYFVMFYFTLFSAEGQYNVATSVKRRRTLLFQLTIVLTLNLVYGAQKVSGKFDVKWQNMQVNRPIDLKYIPCIKSILKPTVLFSELYFQLNMFYILYI